MAENDLEKINEQEKALVFLSFDEGSAFALGSTLRDMAMKDHAPIIVDIRFWGRPLFYAALPGSAPANGEWARRKSNAVRHYYKSSYRLFLEQGGNSELFPARHGLADADYAISGGAFPIRITDVGVVGAVAVSGLPQREDHNLVVRALCRHLDQDEAVLLLSSKA